MRTPRLAGVFVPKLLGAVVIGNLLFRLVAGWPFDMPYAVDMAVRRVLHLAGQDGLANPDDMDVIAGLAAAVVATVIGAAIVWRGPALISRVVARRAQALQR